MVQEYKCPCCGGTVTFDSETQNMKCPYCDSEFSVESLKEYDKVLSEEKSQQDKENFASTSEEWTEDGLNHYVCSSCGGEIITSETLASTVCPYCSNNVILMDKFTGMLKPDLVIPFKNDKKSAIESFKKHLKNKKLLPSLFQDDNHIEEVKGVYVPVWLFSSDANCRLIYRATRTTVWSDPRFTYTRTSYYLLKRSGDVKFQKIPVDGSEKLDDDIMESLAPFDYSALIPFQTAYLSGFLADRYDVDSSTCKKRAIEKAKSTVEKYFRKTVNDFLNLKVETENVNMTDGDVKYALLPVWLLNTKWNGQDYHFAMNGQTGKFVGNLPIDKGKELKLIGLFGGASALLTFLLCLLFYFI